jgi:OOP family OmpA-OmpF porin
MKQTHLLIVLLLLAMLGVPTGAALAGEPPGSFELTPVVGAYVYEGNQDITDQICYGLGLGYHFTERSALEFQFDYMDTDQETRLGTGSRDLSATLYRLNYQYGFPVGHRWVPYATAGIGWIHFDPSKADNENDFLANYGVGVKYMLSNAWSLRGEVQHVVTFDENNNNLICTVGLSYRFGGGKKAPAAPMDTDGDGVSDDRDLCPNTPAGQAVDDRGCPLKDSDGDGVLDNADACPDTPAGVAVDKRGCPLDSDGDGVYDYQDKCPGTPIGQKVDADGCVPVVKTAPMMPEGDADHDGVVDGRDKCPGSPLGVTVDAWGCWHPEPVQFDFGKANILEPYLGQLNEIAGIMNKNKELKIEIDGYTDNIGSATFNQRLSLKRAKAVQTYILEHGGDAERLPVHGFGFEKPVAPNDTAAGRAKNRRVEMVPLR